ncbi:MAG: hypothetical protein ABJA67_03600 [Chthonomonadales bacterium]
MKFDLRIISVAIVVAAIFMLTGCGEVIQQWNLSNAAPFSAYTGKELILSRDVLLVANHSLGAGFEPALVDSSTTRFTLCYKDDQEAQHLEPAKFYNTLSLPAGTRVRVLDTHFWSSRQGVFQAFAHWEALWSTVEIKIDAPGWPSQVNAGFTYSATPYLCFEGREANIRPAPWEPIDTPAERSIPWPEKGKAGDRRQDPI